MRPLIGHLPTSASTEMTLKSRFLRNPRRACSGVSAERPVFAPACVPQDRVRSVRADRVDVKTDLAMRKVATPTRARDLGQNRPKATDHAAAARSLKAHGQ